jgi:hypothetical protein
MILRKEAPGINIPACLLAFRLIIRYQQKAYNDPDGQYTFLDVREMKGLTPNLLVQKLTS